MSLQDTVSHAKYGVPRSTVSRWAKSKQKLTASLEKKNDKVLKKKYTHCGNKDNNKDNNF